MPGLRPTSWCLIKKKGAPELVKNGQGPFRLVNAKTATGQQAQGIAGKGHGTGVVTGGHLPADQIIERGNKAMKNVEQQKVPYRLAVAGGESAEIGAPGPLHLVGMGVDAPDDRLDHVVRRHGRREPDNGRIQFEAFDTERVGDHGRPHRVKKRPFRRREFQLSVGRHAVRPPPGCVADCQWQTMNLRRRLALALGEQAAEFTGREIDFTPEHLGKIALILKPAPPANFADGQGGERQEALGLAHPRRQ